jgi:hypothetical protein
MSVIILGVSMLSDIMLSSIVLSDIMLSSILLSDTRHVYDNDSRSHLDFILSIDAGKLVYQPIIQHMEEFLKQPVP